jgi:type IV secretion system protein VirB4
MAMGHIEGAAFELENFEMRNARLRNLNTLFRNISDDNVIISTHLIRHPDVPELPHAKFRSGFAANLDRAYRDRVLKDRLFCNDYFFSVVVTPRTFWARPVARRR